MSKAMLIDTTRCIGCRACQVACKSWHNLPGERTEFSESGSNPVYLDSSNYTRIIFREIEKPGGEMGWHFISRSCMHCNDPACVTACPVAALEKLSNGPVVYDDERCIGCRYCMMACPFQIPKFQWNRAVPLIRKCDFCADRIDIGLAPSCATACPSHALFFGDRDTLLTEAHRRIGAHPGKYYPEVYGEKIAGGTAKMYLTAMSFEEMGLNHLGFRTDLGEAPYGLSGREWMANAPWLAMSVAGLAVGLNYIHQRRVEVQEQESREVMVARAVVGKSEKSYPEASKSTPWRIILYVILMMGIISAGARLFLGLGATTNLNDAYPWGLWVSFDILSGVALAASGFTMAAIIYIFNLKKFEPLLRPAKLSAFIGYLIFVFGLFFDLGQPWRIWHPMVMWNPHSVLFEVSWCVMLYTTVLGVDIFIMALERWQKYEWVNFFRKIYLFFVVAGVMLSTLHQSSLGALYLLMPEKMSDLWASPAIGPLFFCSAVIGGMSVVILESLISARVYRRKSEVEVLASLSKGLGIALLVYFAMKVTDLYARGAVVRAFDIPHFFFYLELFGTVALPAILLAFSEVRNTIKGLYWTSGLSAFGIVLNRFNVSLTSYGGYRQFSYFPSFIEIMVTLALIAGGILIFEWGTRNLPVYPSELSGEPG